MLVVEQQRGRMNANKLKQYGEDQWRAKPDKLVGALLGNTYYYLTSLPER